MSEIQKDLRETQVIGKNTEERIVPAATCESLRRYGIGGVGISKAVPPFRWVRFDPNISVVMVCSGGEGRVLLGGEWRRCDAGTAYVMPARVLHAYHAVPGVVWEVCWVVYEAAEPALASGLPAFELASELSEPALVRADAAALSRIVGGLYQEHLGRGDATAMHHWTELLHLEVGRITRRWHPEDRLSRLWETVNAALDHPWTVEALAERAGLSGESLRVLSHKQVGRSPGKQLTYLRMQRASLLLKMTDWTVEAVARAVGYENAFAFSTAFKRWAGRSPSGFRAHVERLEPTLTEPFPTRTDD